MKRVHVLTGVVCAAMVLGLGVRTVTLSVKDVRAEVARYEFDGRRYVLSSETPAGYQDVPLGPFADLDDALDAFAELHEVDGLRDVQAPAVLLLSTSGGLWPVLVLELDRTFVKGYEPGVGTVVYRRSVLANEFSGWVADVR